MTTLTAMRGYSGSGKSTKAASIARQTGAFIVNRDQLRKMLLNEWWTGKSDDEDAVTVAEESQVVALLKSGASVVVDATHLHAAYLRKWARIASRLGAQFQVVDETTSVDVCVLRDRERELAGERFVGEAIIQKQAKRFPQEKWPEIKATPPFVVEPVEHVPGLTKAIIVDIDGTVADHEGVRSPFDYTKVSLDRPRNTIIQIVKDWWFLYPEGRVLFVSGRDDSCRDDTDKWLRAQGIPFDSLIMRPTEAKDASGNKLPDFIVKYNLFNEHIRGRYDVQFVLDDRTQVVDVWRRLGLHCLQVAPGDF